MRLLAFDLEGVPMKSLFFFLLDMICAAVDGALHVFEDEPEMSPGADE